MSLTKQDIFALNDVKVEKVEVPEWGGHVFVRCMSAGDRDTWEAEQLANPKSDIRARLLVYSICDENGQLLFTREDINLLSSKSAAALDRLFDKALSLSKIGQDNVAELKKTS